MRSPDAFNHSAALIDNAYGDGLSWTYGSARQHLYSMVVSYGYGDSACPSEGGIEPPSFVGSAYECLDVSNSASTWDGPYTSQVTVMTGASISEPVEGRLMANQTSGDEEIGIGKLTLAVR